MNPYIASWKRSPSGSGDGRVL